MPDPVSITCAVITIATFIKDTIELAEKILEKVPKTRKKLRSLSADVVRGLLDLGKFYDQHRHILDGSADLRVALENLGSEMRAIYAYCSELFPPRASGPINNVVAGIKTWKKCRDIEVEIADLKERVQACYIRFTAFSAARLEQSTSRIEQTVLVLHDEQRSEFRRIEATLQTYSRHDSSYVGPPLSSGSDDRSRSDDIPSQYLRLQIDAITRSLDHLSSQTFKIEQPREYYMSPFRTFFVLTEAQDSSYYHEEVVMNALRILRLLRDNSAELSNQDGAWDMIQLAIGLYNLEMYEDAVTISVWTVDLYRTLCKSHTPVFEPYLALALENLSLHCQSVDDLVKALSAIEESVQIHRALLRSSTSDFRPRLASVLRRFSDILSDKGEFEKSLEFALDSVTILDNVVCEIVEWETWVRSEPEPLQSSAQSDTSGTFTEDSFASATYPPPPNAPARHRLCPDDDASLQLQWHRAFTFRNLARRLDDVGRHSEACEKEKLALAIFRDLHSQFPRTFAPEVADSLRYLSAPLHTIDRPQSDTLSFAEQAVEMYRDLCSSRPKKYSERLFASLWYQALILWDGGNCDSALKISGEAIEFIRQQSHNNRVLLANNLHASSIGLQRLKQDEDAAKLRQEAVDIYRDLMHDPSSTKLVRTIMPDRLLGLADVLQLVGRFNEAVIANREAVERYRLIALDDKTRMPDFAEALSSLVYSLNAAEKYDEALNVGQEVLKLYRKLIRDDPNLVKPFLLVLQKCSFAAARCYSQPVITRSAEIVQDYRSLTGDYSDAVSWGLVDALRNHGFVLQRHRRYPEALLNSEDIVRLFQSIPVESAETTARFISSLRDHADMLYVAGHVKKAIAVTKDAITVAEPFIADSNHVAEVTADAICSISGYMRASGQYEDALASSEKSVELSRHFTSPDDTWFAWRLIGQCTPLVEFGRFAEAAVHCEEAVALCRASTSKDFFSAAMLPDVLGCMSMCVAEAGDERKALGLAQEAVNLYEEIRSKHTLKWSRVEDMYANALVNLSARLAANGHLHDAIHHGLLAKSIYEAYTASGAAVDYVSLITTWHLLSFFFCAVGRHTEGAEAADNLVTKQRDLEVVHPELAMLAQVASNEQKTRPSYLALRKIISKCDVCEPSHLKDS